MQIIPVLDIKDGQVVLAKSGLREQYQPVNTRLCSNPKPIAVVDAFLGVYPFHTFYIADLNAIERRGSNADLIEQICQHFNSLNFLVDSGKNHSLWQSRKEPHTTISPVLGTESYQQLSELNTDLIKLATWDPVLSLDYKQRKLSGCNWIRQRADFRPRRLIILDIDAVGTAEGFHFELLRDIDFGNHCEVIIGGGIRTLQDIQTASTYGVNAILIASSLHDQSLGKAEIELAISV